MGAGGASWGGGRIGKLGELRADMLPKQTAPHSWELLWLPPCSGQELHPPGCLRQGLGAGADLILSAPPFLSRQQSRGPSTGQTTWVSILALLLPAHGT